MENLIHIGNKADKESMENITKAITDIFDSAHANNVDQRTIQEALHTFRSVAEVKNVTIEGCNIIGSGRRKED